VVVVVVVVVPLLLLVVVVVVVVAIVVVLVYVRVVATIAVINYCVPLKKPVQEYFLLFRIDLHRLRTKRKKCFSWSLEDGMAVVRRPVRMM